MEKHERIRFTDEQKLKMLRKTKGKCAHCGKKITLQTMTVEHLYPIDKGGDNSEYNTVALCGRCNNEKSNWVYDISYYGYILDNEYKKYSYYLNKMIYSNTNSTNIFGKCNRTIYTLPSSYYNMFTSKYKANTLDGRKAMRGIAKELEVRQLMVGDIDEEAERLILSGYNVYDKTGDVDTDRNRHVNAYVLRNMFDNSTFYGIYRDNEILGIMAFTDIKNLYIHDEEFINTLAKLNYDNVYVITLEAYNPRFESLGACFANMVAEFMVFNNNLVLYPDDDFAKFFSVKRKGVPVTTYEIIRDNDFIAIDGKEIQSRAEVLMLGDLFESTIRTVKALRDKYNKIEEGISNE